MPANDKRKAKRAKRFGPPWTNEDFQKVTTRLEGINKLINPIFGDMDHPVRIDPKDFEDDSPSGPVLVLLENDLGVRSLEQIEGISKSDPELLIAQQRERFRNSRTKKLFIGVDSGVPGGDFSAEFEKVQ